MAQAFSLTCTSALSRDLFCNQLLKMLGVLTVEIGTDPIDEFVFTQEAVWFDDSPLGVNPMRFEAIQPGTLDGQLTDDDPHAARRLGVSVMSPAPAPDFLAAMPAGIVPHQQQGLLALGFQVLADPLEEGGGDVAYRATIHEAYQNLLSIGTQNPIAGDGLRLGVIFRARHLGKPKRLAFDPGMQCRLRQPRPPDLIGETQHPVRMPLCQADQPVTLLFFAA